MRSICALWSRFVHSRAHRSVLHGRYGVFFVTGRDAFRCERTASERMSARCRDRSWAAHDCGHGRVLGCRHAFSPRTMPHARPARRWLLPRGGVWILLAHQRPGYRARPWNRCAVGRSERVPYCAEWNVAGALTDGSLHSLVSDRRPGSARDGHGPRRSDRDRRCCPGPVRRKRWNRSVLIPQVEHGPS